MDEGRKPRLRVASGAEHAGESGQAAQQAATDFITRNAVTGTARVSHPDTDQSDICADLIAQGDVDIADISDDLPAHLNCPHYWEYSYSLPEDVTPEDLWTGQEQE